MPPSYYVTMYFFTFCPLRAQHCDRPLNNSSYLSFKPQPFIFPSDGTYIYSRYRIRYRRPQDIYSQTVSISSTATQYTVRYLQFGSHNFSIRAEVRFRRYCYSSLYGDYSDPVEATVVETGIYIYVCMMSLSNPIFRMLINGVCKMLSIFMTSKLKFEFLILW